MLAMCLLFTGIYLYETNKASPSKPNKPKQTRNRIVELIQITKIRIFLSLSLLIICILVLALQQKYYFVRTANLLEMLNLVFKKIEKQLNSKSLVQQFVLQSWRLKSSSTCNRNLKNRMLDYNNRTIWKLDY